MKGAVEGRGVGQIDPHHAQKKGPALLGLRCVIKVSEKLISDHLLQCERLITFWLF